MGNRENINGMRDLTATGKAKSGHECSIGKENDVRDSDGRSSGWGVSVNKERDQGPESSFPDPICGALSLSVGSYLVY